MKMVKIGGEYYRQYEDSDTYWMSERWKRWLASDIEREWRFVRWGIETREGEMTWQIVLLATCPLWYLLASEVARLLQ